VDPARLVGDDDGFDPVEELLDDARRWDRVRAAGIIAPEDFLGRLVGGLWGARLDGAGGRLELCPAMPDGWKAMTVRRLRAHRTLLDIQVRRRAEWATLNLALVFGPPIAVAVSLPDPLTVSRVAVDAVPLFGPRATFTAAGEHEVTLYLGIGDAHPHA
jgi:hypothetical protein